MLSTAPKAPPGRLAAHHRALRRIIERDLRYPGLEHCTVETREGHGVLHVLWAWKGNRYFRVDQAWLSDTWGRVHGARVVWIKAVRRDQGSGKRVSRYMVSQYVAHQGALVRLSWSWKTFGIPIVRVWQTFRSCFRERLGRAGFALWAAFLRGGYAALPDGSTWNLDYVRAHGPPEFGETRSWVKGNDGLPSRVGYEPITLFEIGASSWRTRGPCYKWELLESGAGGGV